MKYTKSNITTTALSILTACALPAAGLAQLDQQGDRDQSSSGLDTGSQSITSTERSEQSFGQGALGQSQQVSRISENELEDKMTADRLMGKEVVDNQGERIGKVKDIGLSGALPLQFDQDRGQESSLSSSSGLGGASSDAQSGATAQSGLQTDNTGLSATSQSDSGTDYSVSGSAGAQSSGSDYSSTQGTSTGQGMDQGQTAGGFGTAGQSSSGDLSTTQSASDQSSDTGYSSAQGQSQGQSSADFGSDSRQASASVSGQTGADPQDRQWQSRSGAGDMSGQQSGSLGLSQFGQEINIYVSTEDDDLLEIPVSQLTFNEQDDQLELDMSRDQIDGLADSGASFSSIDR